MKYITIIFVLLFGVGAFAQDSQFEKVDFDELHKRWENITEGYSAGLTIIPLSGHQSIVEVVRMPAQCDKRILRIPMVTLNMLDFYEKISINNCFKFRQRKNGKIYTAFLQDELLKPFIKELKIGSKILLQVRLPGVIVTEKEREMLFITILFQRMDKTPVQSNG